MSTDPWFDSGMYGMVGSLRETEPPESTLDAYDFRRPRPWLIIALVLGFTVLAFCHREAYEREIQVERDRATTLRRLMSEIQTELDLNQDLEPTSTSNDFDGG